MKLERRQVLLAGGALLVSCEARLRLGASASPKTLDALLEAHADALPENPSGGANHYPMAAEVLEHYGHVDSIDPAWVEGARLYAGRIVRRAAIADSADEVAALGHDDRFGDWLDHFRAELDGAAWAAVVHHWAPRLAPGFCAAAFHGVIRTGHAVRALGRHDTPARRHELAVGLAYWASRYTVLPTTPGDRPRTSVGQALADLEHPWVTDHGDVDFSDVVQRLTERPIAPPVDVAAASVSPARDLDEIVREAVTAFLEMLVLERSRIWLLHTVTGPAALQWLLPLVDDEGARLLVEYARQSVIAMFCAFGEPFVPRRSVRDDASNWPHLIERAAQSGSVHGLKLIDALARFDRDDDPLWRSVAEQWFEWT